MIISIDIYLSIDDLHFKKSNKFAVLSPFNGPNDAAIYAYKYIKQMERKTPNMKYRIEKVIYEGTIDITTEVQKLYKNGNLNLVK